MHVREICPRHASRWSITPADFCGRQGPRSLGSWQGSSIDWEPELGGKYHPRTKHGENARTVLGSEERVGHPSPRTLPTFSAWPIPIVGETPNPALPSIIDDRIVARHAREHRDDSKCKTCRERVPLASRTSRIFNRNKKFHQRRLGFHACPLFEAPPSQSSTAHGYRRLQDFKLGQQETALAKTASPIPPQRLRSPSPSCRGS